MRRALLLAVILGACAGTEIRFDPSPSCSYRTVPSSRDVDGGRGRGPERRATDLALGQRHACARLDDGDDMLCWGANDLRQITHSFDRVPLEGFVFDEWRDAFGIVAGGAHTCVRSNDGAECWGNNAVGQLGLGHRDPSPGVTPAALTLEATLVSAGLLHTCAILAGERVACWGDNRFGQLGVDDGADCCPQATDVEGLPEGPLTDLSAGAFHTCAIVDGVPWCWGHDRYGALGDGEAGGFRATPEPVVLPGRSALGITAGAHHTCVTAAPATGVDYPRVSCWGRGERGELGDGLGESRAAPAPVSVRWFGAVVDVRAGGDASLSAASPDADVGYADDAAGHTCAVSTDGEIWCWGANDRGQLGDGTREDALAPVRMPVDLSPRRMAVGGASTCIADQEGFVWCWGANDHGQLGVEPGDDRLLPARATVVR